MSSYVGDKPLYYSCKCLNVKFNVEILQDASPEQISPISSEVLVHFSTPTTTTSTSSSHRQGIKIIKREPGLISDGAQISFSPLQVIKHVKDWKLSTCFNCNTFTHASKYKRYDDDTILYVNCGDLIGAQEQDILLKSSLFSPLYGIIIKAHPADRLKHGSLKPSVVETLHQIQDTTDDFLMNEEKSMKQRVAEYEAKQVAVFQDLKNKVTEQKETLEQQIYRAYAEANEDVDSAFEHSVEEISETTSSTSPVRPDARSDSLVDDMFDLDPFSDQDNNETKYDSEDDDEVPNYRRRREQDDGDILAKSMPIQVPSAYGRPNFSHHAGFNSSDDETPDPKHMQASIKALAQSIGGDGTEMFGDLPRHRFMRSNY